MHPNPRKVLPVILIIALLGLGYWYFFGGGRVTADDGSLSASGTIEAVTVNVSPELAGRVLNVNAAEGDSVQAGQVLIQFDTTLLETRRTQVQAAASAAQAANAAAQSGLS